MKNITENTDLSATDSSWKLLYKISGAAALLMAVFIPIQIIIFILWPPPETTIGWFELFKANPFIGLLDLDLLLIIDQVMVGIMMVALYVLLKKTNPSLMAIALLMAVLGIAAYFASTAAFEMLTLSNKFHAARTLIEKSMYESAGQAVLAGWQGTAFNFGYVMEGIGLLLTALVMLKSGIFGKFTAWVGIIVGIMALLPPTAGTIGMFFALGSLIPLEIWNILVARRLFQIGRK
ncbi:MAG: DUF4386 family protein [Bacteroidales bacterium]|nr:DUF4386 family protein [Lentimicrobiaceae bacterium]MDD5695129.1 DUF4386 family protein [Bacteroidales bacterium]